MNNVQIKRLCLLAMLGLAITRCAGAQSGNPTTSIIVNNNTAITPAPPPANISGQLLTADQLDGLVARIALYPDLLVAQILPAATYPTDVVEAASWVTENNDPALIDRQNWDPSVKALAHYPQVLAMMNEYLSWTRQLGQAVLNQQKDVLNAIQRLRAKAVQNKALINTPEQTVQSVDNDVEIEPTNPDVIYVPQYDPQVIDNYGLDWVGPPLIFGFGFPIGGWCNLDCAWGIGNLYYGNWGYNNGFVRGGHDGNGNYGYGGHNHNGSWQSGRTQLNDRSLNNYRGWEGNQSANRINSSNIARGLSERTQGAGARGGEGNRSGNRVNSTNIARGLSEREQGSSAMRSGFGGASTSGRTAGSNYRSNMRNRGTEWHGALSNYNSGTVTHAYSSRGASSRSSINRSRGGGGSYQGGRSSGGFQGSGRLQSSGRSHGGGSSRGSHR